MRTLFDNASYQSLKPHQSGYFLLLVFLAVLVAIGGYSAHQMEQAGHHITGMNNHIVWGLPHVFAVTLIVTASGALNPASFSSVFGVSALKPYTRLSIVLAITLLIGGLIVLVLDLGRPDRLIIAMTHYNFRSIFSWNIFLYTGFVVIGIGYLWVLMERRFNRLVPAVGLFALVWRLVLTSGTGSIFGFLVGRNALDSAMMAPLFIVLSLVLGTAVFVLILALMTRWDQAGAVALSESMIKLQSNFLLVFLLALVYFSVVHHVANLYVSEHAEVERYILSGPMSWLFWLGHIGIGIVVPVCGLTIRVSKNNRRQRLLWASIASSIGAGVLIYTIIIGSQSTPQKLFPGKTVVASSFGDAGFPLYQASGWEWGLGLGGVALSLLLFLVALRVLPFTPEHN